MLILTLSLDKFDVCDTDMAFEEADNWEGDVVKDLPYALLYHLSLLSVSQIY